MSKAITAADIRAAMRHTYAQPEWALFFEVGNGTGANKSRSADAVAMSLWPSRGLELHGFEIKVSRSDWRREAEDPTKAEAIAQYCDRWWIAAPPDVVPEAELPPAWGLRVWDGRCWRVRREAAKTEVKPCDRAFLAALLRQAHKADASELDAVVAKRVETEKANIRAEIDRQVKQRSYQHDALQKAVSEFEKASGVSIETYDAGNVGAAFSLVRAMQGSTYEGAFRMAQHHEEAAHKIRSILQDCGIPDPAQQSHLKIVGQL
jgi:hypothetical protein